MRPRESEVYGYQVGRGTLVLGGLVLALWLALLAAVGAAESLAWWAMVVGVGATLGLTLSALYGRWRRGPAAVRLEPDALCVPRGIVRRRHERLAWSEVTGVRFVGRASLLRREREQEACYVIAGGRYVVLMSELFEDGARYAAFRDALIAAVRLASPQARVDVDGVAVE